MIAPLEAYEAIVGSSVLTQLRRLGEKLAGLRVVHVNSTREGGGVAEILEWMIPHMRDVGVDASWEVIHGNEPVLRNHQGHPQRPAGEAGRPADEGLEDLPGGKRKERGKAPAASYGGGHRRHSRSPAGPAAEAMPRSQGEMDLARPHRHQPAVPARVEGPSHLCGQIRCEHLLDGGIRPAPAIPAVPGPAQHRPVEREKPGPGP